MMTMTHADCYVRTEAGKAEIRNRSLKLSRPARNLLMVIDASCTGDEWIAKVAGSTPADLRQLVSARLVQPAAESPRAAAAPQRVTVDKAIREWGYDALYTLLTHEARERFGLLKGYRLILRIEGCANLSGLQDVALEFAEHVRRAHGEEPAARFRRQLGATE
ncbi:MAG TPA: hypothetical protein VF457_09135 [Burkholderiaceae bacterium]